MTTRDSQGNIVGKINTIFGSEGEVITTNTLFSDDRPVAQNITVRSSQGQIVSRTFLGGQLLS